MVYEQLSASEIANKLWLQLIFIGLAVIVISLELFGAHPFLAIVNFLASASDITVLGFLAIALISFLENLVFVNVLFPGALVILATMGLTHDQPVKALTTFSFIYFPTILSHLINYNWGKKTKKKTEKIKIKNLWFWFFVNMAHPNFASLYTYRVGNSNLPIGTFLSYFLPIGFLWYSFYGLVMYYWGDKLVNVQSGFPTVFICYLGFWAIKSTVKIIYKKKDLE